MKNKERNNIVICPPCGENVALATKRGANKASSILPLLPRLTAVLPPQGREITTHGFTLIELLVVVLIIGILAAVAVPQYQKAVEKSKATEALNLLKAVGKAADIYYLQNGQIPTKFEELDISLPADWTGTEKIYDYYTRDARSNGEWSIILVHRPSWEQVMIGKISGKYKGAAFGYYLKNDNGIGSSYTSRIVCKEIIGNTSYMYSGKLPSYCRTFFGAKMIASTPNYTYEMP